MEGSQYLLLLSLIFVLDQVFTVVLSYNEDESDKPKSKGLDSFLRALMVSDGANEEGSTKKLTDNTMSGGFLLGKALVIGGLVFMYFNGDNAGGGQSQRLLQVMTFALIGILGLKYVAYAGWFDDKQCANAYVSGFASDHPEDIAFKISYGVFAILLAILLRAKGMHTKAETLTLVFVLPFILYVLHYIFIRWMYLGCQDTRQWFTDNECAISPASFYRNYAVGSVTESKTGSQSWDIYKRVLLLVGCLVGTFVLVRNHVLPSQYNTPKTMILVAIWIAYGLPLFLNWFTTIDLERKLAMEKTNAINYENETHPRKYKAWRCVPNKYGGISGYFLIICVQLAILFPTLL